MTTTITVREKATSVVSLNTQIQRAKFCRSILRKRGITIKILEVATGMSWNTVARYLGLHPNQSPTKKPQTDTTVKIFDALGFDLQFSER